MGIYESAVECAVARARRAAAAIRIHARMSADLGLVLYTDMARPPHGEDWRLVAMVHPDGRIEKVSEIPSVVV